MARSAITATSNDLQADSGSVLWSLIQGEQLEFPVALNFMDIATSDYTYEAVVIEADNENEVEKTPSRARVAGVQTKLVVRVPLYVGAWVPGQQFFRENVVLYNGLYYRLDRSAYDYSALPSAGFPWIAHAPNTIYLQFPSTLSITPVWSIQPSVTSAVYGFFELRITEPAGGIYTRTWKPVRGLVQLRYSPTALVADV